MSASRSIVKPTGSVAEDEYSNGTQGEPKADGEELSLSQVVTVVEGTTRLYSNGKLRFVPAPTPDPRDPLNLPNWRKYLMISVLCFYGSIAFSVQQIPGTLLPFFVTLYADPAALAAIPVTNSTASGDMAGSITSILVPATSSAAAPAATKVNPNALAALANFPGAPPLWKVNLLASLPVLVIGLSNYLLVPLSIVFGRRPVLLVSATLAWVCALWAGRSQTLNEHIAARCIQGLGTGAVESLIPFIIQDISFIHQRNRGIGIIWASQGITTLSLGIGSTHIVANLGWRWLYYILVIFSVICWVLIILFVPETRWSRSAAELRGESEHLAPGEDRPAVDHENYPPRTTKSDLAFFQGGVHWSAGKTSVVEIAQSLFFPNVMVIVAINAVFIGVSLASGQVLSPVLVAPPYNWPLSSLGLICIGLFISSICVFIFGGIGADRVANMVTKKHAGIREPEVHLINLFFPLAVGIFGCILFGAGGEYTSHLSWSAIVIGMTMVNFAFLTINIIGSVYCIECYPAWAGPVLVNAASFRNIAGFAFTFGVTNWVTARGYMVCFAIFSGVIAFMAVIVLALYFKGKMLRKRTNALLKKTTHSD